MPGIKYQTLEKMHNECKKEMQTFNYELIHYGLEYDDVCVWTIALNNEVNTWMIKTIFAVIKTNCIDKNASEIKEKRWTLMMKVLCTYVQISNVSFSSAGSSVNVESRVYVDNSQADCNLAKQHHLSHKCRYHRWPLLSLAAVGWPLLSSAVVSLAAVGLLAAAGSDDPWKYIEDEYSSRLSQNCWQVPSSSII